MDGEPIGDNDRALSKMYLMSEKLYYPETMRVKDAFRWSQAFYPNFDKEFAWKLAGAFQLNTSAKVSKLSTGYSSIFKIVVALSTNAPYVLLDEPVLGLTPTTGTCSTRRCWPVRGAPLHRGDFHPLD